MEKGAEWGEGRVASERVGGGCAGRVGEMLRFSSNERAAINAMLAFCETRVHAYSAVDIQPHTDSAYIYYTLVENEPLFESYLGQFLDAHGVPATRRDTIVQFVVGRMAKRTPESIKAFRYTLEKHKHPDNLALVQDTLRDFALLSNLGHAGTCVFVFIYEPLTCVVQALRAC